MAASVWDQRPADMQPSDVRFEDVEQYNILERKPYSTTLKVPTREDLGDKHCVLKSAISKYVNPVKHWFHVWRPATRTRHLHPSLVLYQLGSLMSSHVFYWVPRAPCHFCVNLHRLNLFLAAKLESMERRFLVQIE